MLQNVGAYWWLLPSLVYVVVLVVTLRRGLWETVGRRIALVAICVFVLLIPTSQWAHGYPFAVLTVLNLLLYVAIEERRTSTPRDSSDA